MSQVVALLAGLLTMNLLMIVLLGYGILLVSKRLDELRKTVVGRAETIGYHLCTLRSGDERRRRGAA